MSKSKRPNLDQNPNRSNVARGMILSGTGKSGGPMRDRRERRSKDVRRSWQMDQEDN